MSTLEDISRAELEKALTAYVPERRWFRAKSRKVSHVHIEDAVPLPLGPVQATLYFVRVEHDGGGDDYVVPLARASGEDAARIASKPHLVVLRTGGRNGEDIVYEVLGDERAAAALLDCFDGPTLEGKRTKVRFEALPPYAKRRGEKSARFEPKPVTTEQTNTSVILGDSFVLKVLRQLDEGTSPDMEMGAFLTRAGFVHAPLLAGAVIAEREGREPSTLGVMHVFTANEGEAWNFTLKELGAFLDDPSAPVGRFGELAELLGKRVGEMHAALGSRQDDPVFAPEPLDRAARERLAAAAGASLDRALKGATRARASLPSEAAKTLDRVQASEPALRERLQAFVGLASDPVAMRVHGDLHLGQVLFTGDDFVIIDFEGEPARPLAERKAKRSFLVDVAGMLRSFHYAAMTGVRTAGEKGGTRSPERAKLWHRAVREAFLRGYFGAVRGAALLPADPDALQVVLDFCVLEKCIYEVNYEADNRPDWIGIPLEGLAEVASDRSS